MAKIKNIHLVNYCGYRDIQFDFTTDGKINPLSLIISCNGLGKSNLLNAIQLLSSASKYYGRNTTLNFRKITYDPNYDPSKQEFLIQSANQKFERDDKGRIIVEREGWLPTDDPDFLKQIMENLEDMEISGTWETESGDKEVIVKTSGVVKDELYQGKASDFHYFIDADNPSNTAKFQLEVEKEKMFIDLAETIYGYKCYFEKEKIISGSENGEENFFYTDFILEKPWGDKIHFKRMSAGERKIATLIRALCDPTYMKEYDLILIDNIAMHIYWKRHKLLIDKLLSTFPDKQFIATTHSGVLPNVLPKNYIYDIETYKIEESKKLGIKLNYPDIQTKNL